MSGETQQPEKPSVWIPRVRDFAQERSQQLTFEVAEEHPLKFGLDKEDDESKVIDPLSKGKSKKEVKVFDPLSQAAFDPLSNPSPAKGFLSSSASSTTNTNASPSTSNEPDYPSWEPRKAAILSKYTTNKTIAVPSFVTGMKQKPNVPVDRVKNRLEQLDQDDEDDETLQLSQKDYIKHIEKKRESLIEAWDTDKRVKALKIAIKCAKLLGDTSTVLQFYPSKFVLITEILEAFSSLVFSRIKNKSTIYDDGVPIPLKDNFRAENVADHAKETCKNWFFKIASIRELIPRIYVEMCIVESYRFIENDTMPQIFQRLSEMIKGIADPVVAAYARVYLARKGREANRFRNDYIINGFDYTLYHMKVVDTTAVLKKHAMTQNDYMDLFTPATEFILESLAFREDPEIFRHVLEKCKEWTNVQLLNAILESFKPQIVARHALEFIQFIKTVDASARLPLYLTLGVNLVLAEPSDSDKRTILNQVWKDVTAETDVKKYIETAEVWISYPLTHLSFKELNILLNDILQHVTPNKAYFDHQLILQSIMDKILKHKSADFNKIFAMSHFLGFLDLFRAETQTQVNKVLLESFTKMPGKVTDMVVINTMFSVAKTVHDSITALSFADEKREISNLLCLFLQKLDFRQEHDKQLNFFVEARRAFANLDTVKVSLVNSVSTLAVQNAMHGAKEAKSAFLRACLAYCFITIPSIESEFDRLYLYVHSGQVALLCQSLPQADEMFKSAINLVKEVPQVINEERETKSKSSNAQMIQFLRYFVSLLVAVPGHPSHGPFYLLEALLKVVKAWDWEAKSVGRIQTYNAVLSLLAANYQRKLPYRWPDVDSNDTLYGGTKSHLKDVQTLIDAVLVDYREELTRLREYIDGNSKSVQAEALVETIYVTLESAVLNAGSVEFIQSLLTPDLLQHAAMKKLRDLVKIRAQTQDPYKLLLQKLQ